MNGIIIMIYDWLCILAIYRYLSGWPIVTLDYIKTHYYIQNRDSRGTQVRCASCTWVHQCDPGLASDDTLIDINPGRWLASLSNDEMSCALRAMLQWLRADDLSLGQSTPVAHAKAQQDDWLVTWDFPAVASLYCSFPSIWCWILGTCDKVEISCVNGLHATTTSVMVVGAAVLAPTHVCESHMSASPSLWSRTVQYYFLASITIILITWKMMVRLHKSILMEWKLFYFLIPI